MEREFYTITADDVNERYLNAFGRTWPLASMCGVILNFDVGKRIYHVQHSDGSYMLQMENPQQFQARLAT